MGKYFNSLDAWKELLSGDFNRGYFAGVMVVLAVSLVLLLLRLIIGWIFRNRRVRAILVPAPDGEIQIARDAVETVIENMMTTFPELDLESLKLYRRGRKYSLQLRCSYLTGRRPFPEVVGLLKEKIFSAMPDEFGITSLKAVRIILTAFDRTSAGAASTPDAPESKVSPDILLH